MDKKKVRSLPPIARAPETEVSRLAARVCEYDDLSALRPLMDALMEADRYHDALQIRKEVADVCRNAYKTTTTGSTQAWPYQPRRDHIADLVLRLCFADLFDWEASLAVVEKWMDRQDSPYRWSATESVGGTAGHVGAVNNVIFDDMVATAHQDVTELNKLVDALHAAGVTADDVVRVIGDASRYADITARTTS